jgi:nitrate/nitrite transporter NarK
MTRAKTAAAEWKGFWYLPVVSGLGYSTAVLHTYGLGPFIEPIQQEFGWSRTRISAGLAIAGLTGAALSVPMGMIVDRIGPRIVGLAGILLMTASFGLLGTATGTLANWIMLWSLLAFANVWMQATVWT